jgi:hypothetical protein
MAGVAAKLPARRIADIREPDRIEPVEHRHFAVRVPPLSGQAREALDLRGIDARLVQTSGRIGRSLM